MLARVGQVGRIGQPSQKPPAADSGSDPSTTPEVELTADDGVTLLTADDGSTLLTAD